MKIPKMWWISSRSRTSSPISRLSSNIVEHHESKGSSCRARNSAEDSPVRERPWTNLMNLEEGEILVLESSISSCLHFLARVFEARSASLCSLLFASVRSLLFVLEDAYYDESLVSLLGGPPSLSPLGRMDCLIQQLSNRRPPAPAYIVIVNMINEIIQFVSLLWSTIMLS